jgi:hypothetical protein
MVYENVVKFLRIDLVNMDVELTERYEVPFSAEDLVAAAPAHQADIKS